MSNTLGAGLPVGYAPGMTPSPVLPGRTREAETRVSEAPPILPSRVRPLDGGPRAAALEPSAALKGYATAVDLSRTSTDDLVGSAYFRQSFERIESGIRNRDKVLAAWDFASQGGTMPGTTLLFSGTDAHARQLAVRVLAKRLDRPLYAIDLGKILGSTNAETLQNLSSALDFAGKANAILHFESAEVLFGSSKEPSDASLEIIAHLLQKLQSQSGVVVVSANGTGGLDPRFYQLYSEKLDFPYPDDNVRAEIWKRAFPQGTPLAELDFTKLAKAQLTMGDICRVAINAALIAAGENRPITMADLKTATIAQYQLTGRSSSSDLNKW